MCERKEKSGAWRVCNSRERTHLMLRPAIAEVSAPRYVYCSLYSRANRIAMQPQHATIAPTTSIGRLLPYCEVERSEL